MNLWVLLVVGVIVMGAVATVAVRWLSHRESRAIATAPQSNMMPRIVVGFAAFYGGAACAILAALALFFHW